MRQARYVLTFIALLLLTTTQAIAEDSETSETDALIEDLQKQLNLTSQQLEELKPIIREKHDKLKQKMTTTLEQGFAEFDQLAKQLKGVSSRMEKKANDILNSEELAQFKEYLNNLDKQTVVQAKDSLIEDLNKLLELTEEQTEKLGPIIDDSFTELSELIAGAISSGEKSFKDFQTQLHQLRNELRDKLNEILDEQQMKKLEEYDNHMEEGIKRAFFPAADVESCSA